MLEKLIPPDDPIRVTRWRWFMAIAVALVLLNAAAGRGLIGAGQYASAEELQLQTNKIDKVLALQIAQTLRDLHREKCRANGNRHVIEQTIEDYQVEYRDLTGIRYPLGECEHE